eukprot:scaffold4424_cov113-Isochrysis_galbana.AAC.10
MATSSSASQVARSACTKAWFAPGVTMSSRPSISTRFSSLSLHRSTSSSAGSPWQSPYRLSTDGPESRPEGGDQCARPTARLVTPGRMCSASTRSMIAGSARADRLERGGNRAGTPLPCRSAAAKYCRVRCDGMLADCSRV